MKSKAFTASVLIRDIRVIRGSEQKVWNREWTRIHANEAQTTENQVVPRARRVCGVNGSKVDVFCSGAQALRVNQQYASSKVPDPDPTRLFSCFRKQLTSLSRFGAIPPAGNTEADDTANGRTKEDVRDFLTSRQLPALPLRGVGRSRLVRRRLAPAVEVGVGSIASIDPFGNSGQ